LVEGYPPHVPPKKGEAACKVGSVCPKAEDWNGEYAANPKDVVAADGAGNAAQVAVEDGGGTAAAASCDAAAEDHPNGDAVEVPVAVS